MHRTPDTSSTASQTEPATDRERSDARAVLDALFEGPAFSRRATDDEPLLFSTGDVARGTFF